MPTTVLRPGRTSRAPLTALREGAVKLAELVATPLVPADYLDMVSPLRASADLCGRIVEVRRETADAATVVLEPSGAWRGHEPGQYVRIGVDVDGVRLWRAYSLTSPADARDGRIKITVKAIPDGVVSNHLVRHARPGTIVQLDQAQGDFTLRGTAPAKALFVTAGSGITPVMGMLRSHGARLEDVVLVHSAPTPRDVIFGAELRGLASTGRIRLVEQHTDSGGMLDAAGLAELVPDLAERETWACGPAGMLDAIEQHFADHGFPERLHTERFRAAVTVAGDGGTVTFSGASTTVEADGASTLLDVGEAAGVLMPSGCRMGICFGCVAPLREGTVRDLRTGELTTAAPGDDVRIQTCISAAAGACDIDL
ncbi:MAG: ferredoxin reductase [Solirubrobacterales bacterium]|nr:ferredoxin reductase [Solirubrobacterales bacterium]